MPSRGRTLRVVIGMPFGEPLGGAELLLQRFLERAADVDVEPHVVFFSDGPWPEMVEDLGYRATTVEHGRFRELSRGLSVGRQLRSLLVRERPDVVFGWITRAHVILAPPAVAAGLRRRLAWYQWTVAEGRLFERAATLLPASLVIVCSRAGADAQRSRWPRRRTHLAYPGIDPPKPRPQAELAALRERLGIPPDRPVVGISGRLVQWKGQHRLLHALALLRAEGREAHGLVVGGSVHGLEPEYESSLRRLAERLDLGDRVVFTGQVADALPYTQLMDVAVNASQVEPFGLVVLEAMALEVPVVAVDRGGPSEIVDSGRTGLLVPTGSPQELAGAVASLLDDPDHARTLGRAGRSEVLRRFTLDRWVEEVRVGLERAAAAGLGAPR